MYKPQTEITTYDNSLIHPNVGINKDTYSINHFVNYQIKDNEVITKTKHQSVKNWVYNDLPADPAKRVPNKKYREIILQGTLIQINNKMKDIIETEGYWTRTYDSLGLITEIFTEPIR